MVERFHEASQEKQATGRADRKRPAAAVVQDAEAHQRLLDSGACVDAAEGVRQGTEDVRKGKIRSAEEFFKEFEARQGFRVRHGF